MRYHHDVCVIGKCLFETSEEHFLDFQHRWHSGSRPTRALPSRNVLYTVSLHKFKTACLFTVIRVRWWDHLLLTLFDLSKPRLILTFAGESIEWIDIEAFVRQFWSITDYQSWGISKIYFNLLRYIFTSPVNLDFFCLQILLQEEELCSQFSRILFISLSMIPSFMSLNLKQLPKKCFPDQTDQCFFCQVARLDIYFIQHLHFRNRMRFFESTAESEHELKLALQIKNPWRNGKLLNI